MMAPSRTPDDVMDDPTPKHSYDINIPYLKGASEYERIISGRTEFPGYLPVYVHISRLKTMKNKTVYCF